MSLTYKTLFEIKLMHEFFITDESGVTKFDEPDQQKRLDFLLGEYTNDRESIDRDLDFAFPESFAARSSEYNLKLLPSYSGCKVLMRVNPQVQTDNSVLYEPFVPLPDNLRIPVLVSRKNNLIDVYTNGRINRPVSSSYFFTNENLPGAKIFPFLPNDISATTSGYAYEQGELALSGTTIMEYYKDETAADAWKTVAGQSFANENDRLLLPLKFNYAFSSDANITQADFTLKDKNGNIIKSASITATEAIRNFTLNFSDDAELLITPDDALFADYIFSLEVSGTNGYSSISNIIFYQDSYDKNAWALISIRATATNSAFNLLASDGFLVTRKDSAGVLTDAPVFEIPMKSRFGYWRYINNKGDELDLIADLTGYLFKLDKILQTKEPKHISKTYFILTNDTGTETKYLPNPNNYEIQKDDKDRLCFDIKVARSDLFPIIP